MRCMKPEPNSHPYEERVGGLVTSWWGGLTSGLTQPHSGGFVRPHEETTDTELSQQRLASRLGAHTTTSVSGDDHATGHAVLL